jgi:hypothetical protein
MDLDIRFTVCRAIIITDSRDLNPKPLLYKWETSSTEADGTNLSVPNLLWDRMRLVVSPAEMRLTVEGKVVGMTRKRLVLQQVILKRKTTTYLD